MRKKYPYLYLGFSLALAGCAASASHHQPSRAIGASDRQTTEGYSVLYKLMSDESRVGGIFFIKKADESISAPIKELSLACKAAKKRLEDFRDADNRLNFEMSGLPYMEQRSRALEASYDQHLLLFSSGKEFERTLVFTQAQAMGYAMQLSQRFGGKGDRSRVEGHSCRICSNNARYFTNGL